MSRATAPLRDLIRPCQRLLTPCSALHPRVGAYRPPRCSRPWRSPERNGFASAMLQNTSSHNNSTFVFSCIRTNPSAFDSPFNAAYLSRILRSLTRAHPQEGCAPWPEVSPFTHLLATIQHVPHFRHPQNRVGEGGRPRGLLLNTLSSLLLRIWWAVHCVRIKPTKGEDHWLWLRHGGRLVRHCGLCALLSSSYSCICVTRVQCAVQLIYYVVRQSNGYIQRLRAF